MTNSIQSHCHMNKKRPHIEFIRGLFYSPLFPMLPALVTCICAALGESCTMTGLIINAQLTAIALLLCDDLAPSTMCFLAIMCGGATLFGNWKIILQYLIPWGILPAFAILFHFFYYRKPHRIGISIYALAAIAIAGLLGGIAAGAPAPLSSAHSAFYYFGISIGPIFFYLLFSPDYKEKKRYDALEYLLVTLLLVDVMCAAITVCRLLQWWEVTEAPSLLGFRDCFTARNSLANIMIFSIPAPFYFAKKHIASPARSGLCYFVGIMLVGALFLTTSRTAILAGGILLVLCLFYYARGRKNLTFKLVCIGLTLVLGLLLLIRYIEPVLSVFYFNSLRDLLTGGDPNPYEIRTYSTRLKLILASWQSLAAHPLFGSGILTPIVIDMHAEEPSSIIWYHSYLPQVWGSMGLVGCAAYALHLVTRLRLALSCRGKKTRILVLSALGSFLYSMTDPGEFMPVPFAMMATLIFVLLEKHAEEKYFLQNLENQTLFDIKNW